MKRSVVREKIERLEMKKRASVIIRNMDEVDGGERRAPKKMKNKPCDGVDLLDSTTVGIEKEHQEGKCSDLLVKSDMTNTFLVDENMEPLPDIDVEEPKLGAIHNKSDHHVEEEDENIPIPMCHNIVSTSQIRFSLQEIDLQRLASLFPFTSYDRKRWAAITIRLANPHCTCLLFGSGKLVITGSTSFHACIVASQTITDMLREVNPRHASVDFVMLM
jgi:hypothetical protein